MTRKALVSADLRPGKWNPRLAWVVVSLGVVAACVAIRYYWGAGPASAGPQGAVEASDAPAPPATATARGTRPAGSTAPPKVVATVNGEQITRQVLAEECLRHHGKEVLESLVNKYLIVLECQRLGLGVSQEEVNLEMQRLPKQYGVPLEQWMQMLKDERGIAPAQYASDIIWPMLALRKIAGNRLQISREELLAEYETLYGPAVKARLIVCTEKSKAEKIRAAAAAQPSEFGNLAKEHSEDLTSASVKGLVQPIRKHAGNKQIEQAAFALKDGEVSQVLQIGSQYAILQRESVFPARDVPLAQVQGQIEENVRQRKLREVSGTIFQELQKKAKVVNVMSDPQLSGQYPGVAAQINGNNVTLQELAERCIERHGEQALDAMIHRRLIEQACRKQNVAVSGADLDKEIARAAEAMLRPKADGSPDVETWVKMATEQQKVSEEVYRRDSVWPVVALKKLVGETAQVTEDDLRRGFEANYGPRVRCRAIVVDNSRRAQQVWELARKKPDPEYFGDLAEKYSIESSSKALRGQVPPIQKHGGQPELEKEAFGLKPGQLSGIVPVGPDKCVILLCEEHTVPKQVEFAEVRDLIRDDVHEKKLRLAMSEHFQRLQDEASIENFLSGTRRSPRRADGEKTAQPAARPGAVRR